jgi:two-component system response regulator HydG
MPRILLIEDEADLRLLLEHVLIDAGYAVEVTGTARGGEQLLRRQRYDLVIADHRLPDGSGISIAGLAGQLGIRALVITGYAFTLSAEEAEQYEILLKPLSVAEILTAIERALDGS